MRIHSLTLNNYRGVESLSLDGLPDTGVIVISGNNEQGKSTVLEALDNLLHVKHSSTSQSIRATQPRGKDVGPQASITATIGPYTFTLSKQWVRKSSCTLEITAPKFEQLTGSRAEDKLASIITEHLDAALLKTLFVEQGELDPIFDAAGIPTLATALDATDDGSGSTQDDTGIVDKVATEYHRYFTKAGKKNTAYKEAESAVDRAREKLAEATRTYNEVQNWVSEIEQLTARRDDYAQRLPVARAELEEAAQALTVAESAKKQLDDAELKASGARAALERITERIADREAISKEMEKIHAAHATALSAVEEAQAAATAEEQDIAAATEAINSTFAAEETASEELKKARLSIDRVAAHEQLVDLKNTKAQLDELDEKAVVASVPEVTNVMVSAVEEATTALTVATKVFEQSATEVSLRADSAQDITVNQATVAVGTEETSMYLDGETTITINGVDVRITPGGSSDPRRDVQEARKKLEALLSELECESLAQVRARRDAYAEHIREQEALKKDRARILGEHTAESLNAAINELEGTLEGVDTATLPTAAQAKAAAEQAQAAVDAIRLEREQLRARNAGLMAKPAGQKLTRAVTELEFVSDNLASVTAKVEAAEAKGSLSELIAQRESAAQDVDDAGLLVAQAKEYFAAADFDTAAMVHAGARANVDNLTVDLDKATISLTKFESYVETSDGSAEDLERAKVALSHAEYALASLERRATAAQLLYTTLTAHRDAARRKYSQPFADQLARLSRPVFGSDVSFELNEDLKVSSRIAGGTEIQVSELSGGAQEQLAIIARFAVAGLVQESAAMPVFIDDALGSTDASRLKVMGSVFAEAGKHSQVFVFTCLPERYNYVAGKHEYRMADITG